MAGYHEAAGTMMLSLFVNPNGFLLAGVVAGRRALEYSFSFVGVCGRYYYYLQHLDGDYGERHGRYQRGQQDIPWRMEEGKG